MVDRQQRRALTIPAIARVTRSRDFRSSLATSGGDPRKQTMIALLPDDTVGYMLDRAAEAGGAVVAAMLTDDGACSIAVLSPASEARLALAEEDDAVTDLNDDIHVAMFFDYLASLRTVAVVRRVAARLVSTEPLQPS